MKSTIRLPLLFLLSFISLGIWRFTATGSVFYLLNFSYIGMAIALGLYLGNVLSKEKKGVGRKITQLMVGLYMLVFLGVFGHENMQLEGFFIYLLLGVFQAAVLHYAVAKIVGPFIFGRAWCGYACWTAMVLDFLPFKVSGQKRPRKWGILRYVHFVGSLALVLYLWNLAQHDRWQAGSHIEWQLFLVGNALYYLVGIALAFRLKDNRAFCSIKS